ncbi:MAG: 7TM diverse intracellular signaling domain-containing protein [Sphingobacteriaceae bacterium]|nr:7TM diverse intracellular signaling domain-containing protein [Sphingobacteriaceae bacterium]
MSSFRPVAAVDTLFVGKDFKASSIPPPMQVFTDVSFNASPAFINEVMLLKGHSLASDRINFGYIKAAFWFKLILHNPSEQEVRLIVSLDNSNIDSVTFYSQNPEAGIQLLGLAGDHVKHKDWVLGSRQAAVGIQLAAGETKDLLIKARNAYSGNMILPIRVWSQNYFYAYQQGYHLVWGFYFGFLLINIALAFSGILLLRAPLFFWYGLFLIASLIYSGFSFGFIYQYFTGEYPMSNDTARTTFLILVSGLMFKFAQSFLHTKTLNPALHLLINICLVIQVVLLAASLLVLDLLRTNFNSIFPWFLILVLSGYVMIVVAAISSVKRSPLRSKAFLAAYGVSLLGGSILILTDLNFLPYTNFTLHAPWIGSILEIVIFTGIMLYEFKLVGDQKIKLEQQVTEEQTNRLTEFFRGQEKERERIARDLHDNVAGSLVGARFLMPVPQKLVDKLEPKELLSYERALHTLDRSIRDVRNLSHNLQPPAIDSLSLKYELERLIADHQAMEPKTLFHLSYKIDPNMLNNDIAVAIFRVCQECMLNIFKHAFATSVHLMIESTDNKITIYVTDNGRGFNKAEVGDGIGLQNVRSRLAFTKNLKTQIDSAPAQGTHISISFEV